MNRVIVITGASRGLGLALSRKFLEAGDRVFGLSKSRRYWKSAKENISAPDRLTLDQVDLTSEAEVKHYVRKLKKQASQIDILINNAGVSGKLLRVEEIPQREIQTVMAANLFSAFYITKHLIPIFRAQKRGAMIINIASMAAIRAVPRLFAYSAGKFGILALSQCIAKENQDANLKSITVCPGGMNTGMRASLFGAEDANRQQTPEFVADVIMQVIDEKIHVDSGGDITIRHGKVTEIRACPQA